MSRGPGRWQRAALALSDEERQFREIAVAVNAETYAERSALRRALDRLVAAGRLGKRPGKRMYGGPRNIVWFRPKQ
jgi:hypothetical protein